MKLEVKQSFEKDISKIRDKQLAAKVLSLLDKLELSSTLSEIPNLKKLKHKGNYYRIKVGDYRLGFKFDKTTIILLRFMPRKDIYRYFP